MPELDLCSLFSCQYVLFELQGQMLPCRSSVPFLFKHLCITYLLWGKTTWWSQKMLIVIIVVEILVIMLVVTQMLIKRS